MVSTVTLDAGTLVFKDMGGYRAPGIAWPRGTRFTVIRPSGRAVAEMTVTPELAAQMLLYNADNQRRFKPNAITRYALDMERGDWTLTHQGVAFNRNGFLCDGQNRLNAVVQSRVAVPMTVWIGAGAEKEMNAMDRGCTRNLLDAVHVVRMDANNYGISVLQSAIRYGLTGGLHQLNALSDAKRLELLSQHSATISTVLEWFGYSQVALRLGRSQVKGAVFCAALTCDHPKLERFVRVLTEQMDGEGAGDAAAKKLRSIMVGDRKVAGRDLFMKTCWLLLRHLNGEPVGRNAKACDACPFPFSID